MGFHPEALGKDPLAAAIRARELNAAVHGERRRVTAGDEPSSHWPPGSMGDVISQWQQSDGYKALVRSTQQSYGRYVLVIEKWCGRARPQTVSRKAIKAWQRAQSLVSVRLL